MNEGRLPWKDKILDYEIEIMNEQEIQGYIAKLEKIRFSITRLKCVFAAIRGVDRILTWKDKILDYEIEIEVSYSPVSILVKLEKIRFSITRLKCIDDKVFDDVNILEKIRFSITRLKLRNSWHNPSNSCHLKR